MTTDLNKDAIMVLPNASSQSYPERVPLNADLSEVITQLNRFAGLMNALRQPRFPERLTAETLKSLKIASITIGGPMPTNGQRGHLYVDVSSQSDVAVPFVHDGTGFVQSTTIIDAVVAAQLSKQVTPIDVI